LCASTASFAADGVSTNGVRNPFWPMGYEGVRETISPNVRKKPKKAEPKKAPPAMTVAERKKQEAEKAAAEKAAKEAAEKAAREKAEKEAAERAEAERKKREITGAHWDAARAALKFAGRVKLREGDANENSSVVINGKVYADGDLISITHDSRRFTWRVEGLSGKSKLKLVRIRAKYLEKPGEADKKSDKGANP
jgi:phage protein D